MPILVNGELLPKVFVQEEGQRLAAMPAWQAFPGGPEKRRQLREAAEMQAIDRLLLRQEAQKDLRPIDPEDVTAEIQRLRRSNACPPLQDGQLCQAVEADLRMRRTLRELMGPVPPPSEEQMRSFFSANGRHFQRPESVHAAHIVKHVDASHPEELARAGIQSALADLERGESFTMVVERHSDCKQNGGDLGVFYRGAMVEDFENVVFAMQPGERSAVFRTRFGFHIAEVRERIPPGTADFGEVREVVRDFLIAMSEREARGRVATELRARGEIRRISVEEAEQLAGAARSGLEVTPAAR